MGVPMAVRANLRLALTHGRFDVVHGFEPDFRVLVSRAHLDSRADRCDVLLGRPARLPGTAPRRDRLRTRIDALLATSEETARAATDRFEGDYDIVPLGVDVERFRPAPKRRLLAIELEVAGR